MADILTSADVYKNFGQELRELREKAGLSQHQVGEILGFNRDAISKQELGLRQIMLFDYLILMDFYRDIVPDHPGVELAKRMLQRKSRK